VIIILLISGIISCNISQTRSPQLEFINIGEVTTGGDAYDVWVDVDRNLAYVTCGYNGLRIFNISDPSNPILIVRVPESLPVINTGHGLAYAHQLLVDNDIIYIGDGPGGLTIINCSDLTNPIVLTHYDGGYTWDIQLRGNIAFIVNGWNNLGNPGLMILNVSNPSDPVLISNYQTDFDVTDLELEDDRGYMVSYDYGLKILDISNYSNPLELGHYLGPPDSVLMDVEITGNLAYLSFWNNGLQLLDCSDPSNITVLSEYNPVNISEFSYLTVEENYIYLAALNNGVVVLDTSNPYFPVEIGRYNDSGSAYGIFVRDNVIFLADRDEGFKILEMEMIGTDFTTISSNDTSTDLVPTSKTSSSDLIVSSSSFETFLSLVSLFTLFTVLKWKKRGE
jgi:hypothetical protein